MLIIRLSRTGKRKKPSYRLIVQDKKKDPWSKAVELLGTYNPAQKNKPIFLKKERIIYWLSQGAKTSATVHNLLVNQNIISGKKIKAWTPKKNNKETNDEPEKK